MKLITTGAVSLGGLPLVKNMVFRISPDLRLRLSLEMPVERKRPQMNKNNHHDDSKFYGLPVSSKCSCIQYVCNLRKTLHGKITSESFFRACWSGKISTSAQVLMLLTHVSRSTLAGACLQGSCHLRLSRRRFCLCFFTESADLAVGSYSST